MSRIDSALWVPACAGTTPGVWFGRRENKRRPVRCPDASAPLRLRLCDPVIQRVAGAADGADRILLAAGVEQLAQPADMDVDGALVDIDVAAPDAVEQLLAREHAARMLQEELEQAIFGRPEIDRTARTRHAALLAVELDVAIGEHGGETLGACAPQQAFHASEQCGHRERLDDVVVGAGRKSPHPLAL